MIYGELLTALNGAGVRYLVAGGLAVNLHGFVRMTTDIDLMIGLDEGNARAALDVFGGLGYVTAVPVPAAGPADAGERERWIADKGAVVFTFVHARRSIEHIDVFLDPPIDFGRAWEGRAVFTVGGLDIPVVSLEDLIVMKKAAGRASDLSDARQLEDVRDMKRGTS
jgi:hypothetical protein